MLRTPELLDLLERHDRFLVSFAVSVLRSLDFDAPEAEDKLLGLIKGSVFSVPLPTLSRFLKNLTDKELARRKIMEALCDRQAVVQEIQQCLMKLVGPERIHCPLITGMNSGETHEKAFSHVTLALLGYAEARDSLPEAFRSFPRILRWGILTLLEHNGDQIWMPMFIAALEDAEVDVVRIAVQALGRSALPAAAERLRQLLQHSSEIVVVTAVQALAAMRDNSAVPLLLELFRTTASPRIQATIVSALGEFPETTTLQFLGAALDSSDRRIRANAVLAIQRKAAICGTMENALVERVKKLLQDPDHRVRADAVQCLWNLGWVECVDEVECLLQDNDENCRASGAYLCGKLKLHQCMEKLVDLSKDRAWKVRKMAALALLSFGPQGLNRLESLLLHGDLDQQVVAAYAVGLADDPRGVDWLMTASRSDSEMADMATSLLLRLSRPVSPCQYELNLDDVDDADDADDINEENGKD